MMPPAAFQPLGYETNPCDAITCAFDYNANLAGSDTSFESLDSSGSESSNDSIYEQYSSSESIPRVLLRRSRQSIKSARLPKDVGMCGLTMKQLLHMRCTLPPELRRMLCDHCLRSGMNIKPKLNSRVNYYV